jgi:hypothetical protein
MTDQHRATPEQWEHVEICAGRKKIPWATADCILELRDTIRALCIARNDLVVCNTEQNQRIEALEAAQLEQAESHRFCTDAIVRRVEALEAAQQDKLDRLIALDREDPTPDPAMTELRAASAEARPVGGLVERVANAISEGDEPDKWHPEARDAIHEVAAWLSEHTDDDASAYWAARLEQEANRG